METNSKLKAAFKSEIFTVSFAPIWVIFQNAVTYYSNQTWYQDVPLHYLSEYQISMQSYNPLLLYGNFNTFTKRKKNRETKPIF